MKKICSFIAAIIFSVPFMAQESEIIKSGWNFGPLPVVGFDSDLGFQYGVCCDIFNYGDGTNYPQYDYKINIEASTYTKGSYPVEIFSLEDNIDIIYDAYIEFAKNLNTDLAVELEDKLIQYNIKNKNNQ